MSDANDTDDERYANASFENDTDEEIPEITDLESETENSVNEDDPLPSVKGNAANGNYIHRLSKRISSTRKYGYSNREMTENSSEEENATAVNKTQVEITTEPMSFGEDLPQTSSMLKRHSYSNDYNDDAKRLLEPGNNTESCTEEDDEDYKQIEVMEDRYKRFMKQSALVANERPIERKELCYEEDEISETFGESEREDDKGGDENFEAKDLKDEEAPLKSDQQSRNCSNCAPINNSIHDNQCFTSTNVIQLLQNSLNKMKANEDDILVTDDVLHPTELNVPLPIEFDHINIPNSQEIAMVLMDAVRTTILENSNDMIRQSKSNIMGAKLNNSQDVNSEDVIQSCGSTKVETPRCLAQTKTEEFKEKQVKKCVGSSSKNESIDIDDDISESQVSYCRKISSYNSEESLFKRNLYKELQSPSAERVKTSQTRKSWSFSNERMREIERHNRILLRKILSQKPTYTSNSQQKLQQKVTTSPYPNTRVSSAAVNRKKQQRQIDLDNQVLKRKIEAISLRRPVRP
uniref:Cilia- and flagella-associated protein 97 n=1 Tax=Glossina brevipalpis TaxID=37001 RepID=A0A1A9W3J5_9MUSC